MSSSRSEIPELPAPPRVVAVVGNPRPGSRTAALARSLAAAVAHEISEIDQISGIDGVSTVAGPETLDLSELTERHGAPLGAGSGERWAGPLSVLHAADLLLVVTPVYKGSYTGLLKAFLDHVGGGALHGTVAVPVVTVGSPAHSLAADLHLRPLLIELGASTPTQALVVGNDVIDDPEAAVRPWLERNRGFLRPAARTLPSVTVGSRS